MCSAFTKFVKENTDILFLWTVKYFIRSLSVAWEQTNIFFPMIYMISNITFSFSRNKTCNKIFLYFIHLLKYIAIILYTLKTHVLDFVPPGFLPKIHVALTELYRAIWYIQDVFICIFANILLLCAMLCRGIEYRAVISSDQASLKDNLSCLSISIHCVWTGSTWRATSWIAGGWYACTTHNEFWCKLWC